MCPERLLSHLKLRIASFADYEDIKTEIVEQLAEELRTTSRGGRAASLEQAPPAPGGDEECEDSSEQDEEFYCKLDELDPSGYLGALVKNVKFHKKGGGKAEGKGGGKA